MSLRRTAFAAVIAMSLGLTIIVVLQGGFSTIGALRLVEMGGVIVMAAAAMLGAMAIVGVRMAGWKEPESEAEFERVVLRAERLAREGTAAEPTEDQFMDLDPYDDEDFEELVRDAMDELPDLLRAALDRNVAVVPTGSTTATARPATTTPTRSSSSGTRSGATSATTRTCCATR